MRQSAGKKHSYKYEQSEEQSDEEDDDETQISKSKKVAQIPRFIKNEIDEIDTDLIIMNIGRTQYEVVEEVALELGWTVERSKKSEKWDVMWIDSHIEAHDLFKLNEHQKISHFPAIYVLTKKNFLGRSLMKMNKQFPEQYNFFPFTWSIPADYTELLRYDEKLTQNGQSQYYIYKPEAQSQGKGIKLFSNIQLFCGKTGIVQTYENRPLLIENLKFDLRIYVLILGSDPLRIFIYDEGLGRFATQKYQKVGKKNMNDVHMHLTNYAINKNSSKFIYNRSDKDMGVGHKRSLSAIYKYLASLEIDVDLIKSKIDKMIIKTLIVGQPMISHTYGLAQSNSQSNDLCFQILGFDVLIRQDLEPVLLEVNHTPSFKTDTPLDKFIKKNLIKDTLKLLNMNTETKKQRVAEKKEFIQLRSQRKLAKISPESKQTFRQKKCKERDEFELNNLGNFRKIFPIEGSFTEYKSMIEYSNRIFSEHNGLKIRVKSPKQFNSKLRPRSLDKNCYAELMLNKHALANQLEYKNTVDLKTSQQGDYNTKNSSKFPCISPGKKMDRNRNFSAYMTNSAKNDVLNDNNGKVEKGSSTSSIRKSQTYKPHVLGNLQQQLVSKGSFISPKVIELEEVSSGSNQLMSSNVANSYSPSAPSVVHRYYKNGRNLDEIANEVHDKMFCLPPPHKKMTYQNLLNTLASSSSLVKKYVNKQDLMKLKPFYQ